MLGGVRQAALRLPLCRLCTLNNLRAIMMNCPISIPPPISFQSRSSLKGLKIQGLSALSMGLVLSALLQAQAAHAANEGGLGAATLLTNQGPDRDAQFLKEAKKEGGLALYTSQSPKDTSALVDAFQKKYELKVTVWRASGEKVIQRAVTEAHAHRFTPDVFESDAVVLEALYREKLLQEFYSPAFKDLPATAFQPGHF